MKLIDGMVLAQLGDSYVVASSGEGTGFRGIVKLNKTGAEIWRGLEEGHDVPQIAAKLVEKYDGVTYDQAMEHTEKIIRILQDKGILV